jgi:methyltransferase-like protein 6
LGQVGNTTFPLLEENDKLFIHAIDFSQRAIKLFKVFSESVLILGTFPTESNTNLRSQDNPQYSETKCIASVCDIVNDPLPQHVPEGGIDVAMLIFVMSAIAPEKMNAVHAKAKAGIVEIRYNGMAGAIDISHSD